ncbi:hypothetical protein A8709_28915 [Paenibacillus pectinilyticus]|uniref:HTH araC/xylS-type domain-containing protein n=1 Tax=Paenibacillus pectinilyticus TaxID=512399 RepID=A0A1C0ZV21_9BACL|nr:AraC family transcriptional regulator [Paenibacillus pectinilyticus]OCT11888.1 hypothetical protein A8709_28915 [Paenibacillus pectinilyticus]
MDTKALFYTDAMWLESTEFPFYTARYTFSPGEVIPLHAHQFVEFVYVSEGVGRHTYRGQSFDISKGDVFVIEPYVPHAYEASDGTLVVYNILFQSSVLESEIRALSKEASFLDFYYMEPFFRNYAGFQTRLQLHQHEHMEIVLHLDRLLQEFQHKAMGYRIIIKNRLIELFIDLSRRYASYTHPSWPPLQDFGALFEDMAKFISLHYASPLQLEQMSSLSGMSLSTFSVKFKQHFGKTFVEYRNAIRIQVAQDLLIRTDSKIAAIAEQVGFEDLSFFNKLFKRITKQSPKDFREGKSISRIRTSC